MLLFCGWPRARRGAEWLLERTEYRPKWAIICGTGLGGLADELQDAQAFTYADIPHFPQTTVAGHAGRLVFGTLAGVDVVLMQGRAHYYEGYSYEAVTRPVRIFKSLGVEAMVVTNAAGAVQAGGELRVGDIMMIVDHVNMAGLAGKSPLVGPNDERLGGRFVDMSDAYCPRLRAAASMAAEGAGVPLRRGVFAYVGGPTFETPAEVRLLKVLGADAVAMSSVPEVTVARHVGISCLGFSMISNICLETHHPEILHGDELSGEKPPMAEHLDVLKNVQEYAVPNLKKVLRQLFTAQLQGEVVGARRNGEAATSAK